MERKLIDLYGRKHNYLRISITDRCNLRCQYCMGPDGIELMNHEDILSFEEIVKLVKVLAPMGISRLRITGGEPLVRKGVEKFIANLAEIPGIEDIGLTTNGQILAEKAKILKEAGLNRINISLDSLNPIKYTSITRGGSLEKVIEAIHAAIEYNLQPVKINVVLIKGFNDDEIENFLKMTIDLPVNIRFIEYMPIGGHDNQWSENYLPLEKIQEKAQQKGWEMLPEVGIKGNGTAENYRIKGAQGTVGFIHPVSKHFCATCSRLRLTADGRIKNCLFWQDEVQVRPYINEPKALQDIILKSLVNKPKRHIMGEILVNEELTSMGRLMSQIGG